MGRDEPGGPYGVSFARSGIYVGDEGIEVRRQFFRRRRIAWDQITMFEAAPFSAAFGFERLCVAVRYRDGQRELFRG
jgi:hypothetical protein